MHNVVRVRGSLVPVGSPVEGRSLPAGHAYTGGDGRRAALRRLRQSWRAFEKACKADPRMAELRERVLDHAAEEPDPEACALHLAHAAKVVADDTANTWRGALRQIVDELDARSPEHQEVPPCHETNHST